jgi:Winged helix DNA-binding domain
MEAGHPAGVPDNGGLVLAGAGGQSLITGLRPSQYLTFSSLPATSDNGQDWSSESPVRAASPTCCAPPARRCGRARRRPLPSSAPAHPEGARFTPDQAQEVTAAIGAALAGTGLTAGELTEAIADRGGPRAAEPTMEAFGDKWPRWRQLTSTAAHRGMLRFGPDRGRKMTCTGPHRWLPGLRPADCDAALHTLITRYLHAYRPATPQRRRQLQRGQLRPAGFQRAQDPDNPHPASRPGAAAALLAQLSRPPCPIAAPMPGQGPPLPGRRSNEATPPSPGTARARQPS